MVEISSSRDYTISTSEKAMKHGGIVCGITRFLRTFNEDYGGWNSPPTSSMLELYNNLRKEMKVSNVYNNN